MKKQNKKSKGRLRTRLFGTPRRIAATTVCVVVSLVALYFLVGLVWMVAYRVNQALDQAEIEPVRGHIVRAVENLGTDAPVEARTGDIYFPPAKLYLPVAGLENLSSQGYKYEWDAGNGILTIIDKGIVAQAVTKLYNVQDFQKMFDQVPSLQACSRGVMVVPFEQTFDYTQRAVIQPGDGKRYRLYTDDQCQRNESMAELFKVLKSY